MVPQLIPNFYFGPNFCYNFQKGPFGQKVIVPSNIIISHCSSSLPLSRALFITSSQIFNITSSQSISDQFQNQIQIQKYVIRVNESRHVMVNLDLQIWECESQ